LAFRVALLASSGPHLNLCCRAASSVITGRISCICALRVPPSREALAGQAARSHHD
jgi:hypothetical protein